MKKRLLSLFMVAAITASMLVGCGSGATQETASDETAGQETGDQSEAASGGYTKAGGEGEVVVGVAADPENMGPWAGMSMGRIAVLNTVYEYMVGRDDDGEIKGVLAKSWEQVDDMTYSMEIYDYIHDTEGNPLTANDIKFCFETAQSTQNYSKLEPIEEITVIDDYNLEFKFNKVLAIGEFENVMLDCAIVTQAAYEASDDQMATDPIGTTAYKVVEYTPGSKLVVEDTGDYWQTDESLVRKTSRHNVPKITFSVITESSQHTVALQTHSIDISNGVPATDIDKFREGGEYSEGNAVSIVMDNLTYDLQYNMSDDSIFKDDLNLRLAIAYAIDKEGLNLGAFDGKGAAVKDFANATYPDYNSDWDNEDYFDYNVETAKEYLAQSNYSGQTVRIMYTQDAVTDTLGAMLQAYLGEIGVTVELIGYDAMMATATQYDSTAFDILIKSSGSTDYIVNQWKLCFDARDFTSVTGGTSNFIKDDKLQELIEAALSVDTYGPESINAFHDYVKENCYAFGLVEGTINIVHSSYVTDVALDSRNQILPGACTYAE